jgi:hypothetical protein
MTRTPEPPPKTETVADRFQGAAYEPVEEIVRLISDGSFNTGPLNVYPFKSQLAEACREALNQMRNEPFNGRGMCAAIMSRAMELLKIKDHLNAPRGWLPVLKKLREDGGPATGSEPRIVKDCDVLNDTSCPFALSEFREQLAPFADILKDAVKHRAMPSYYSDAVDFLNYAIEQHPDRDLEGLVTVRDSMRGRIPANVR